MMSTNEKCVHQNHSDFFKMDTRWTKPLFYLTKTLEKPIKSRKVKPQFPHGLWQRDDIDTQK